MGNLQGALFAAVRSQEGGHADNGGRLLSEGHRGSPKVIMHMLQSRALPGGQRSLSFSGYLLSGMEPRPKLALGDLPTLQQSPLAGPAVGWR